MICHPAVPIVPGTGLGDLFMQYRPNMTNMLVKKQVMLWPKPGSLQKYAENKLPKDSKVTK